MEIIMLLVVDVGNTNIAFGAYEENALAATWRMATVKNKTSDEIGIFLLDILKVKNIEKERITDCIISSVVPPIMYSLTHAIRKYLAVEPLIVNNSMDFGLKIKYENAAEVGADRLVNAYAAYEMYGGPLVIIDFGTATTFCAVSDKGEYLGGAICPGVKISLEALYENTAKLPRVDIGKPEHVIGASTVEAMKSGTFYSYVGGVDYIADKFKQELGEKTRVVATGGLARLISEDSKLIDIVNPNITIDGLNMLYNKIKGR